MIKSHRLLTAAVSAGALLFSISGAQAAGFYIQEQSVKGLGTAFAGSTTSLDDASTIYFNPAGMTKLDGMQINAGVHVLIPDGDLKDNGSTFGGNNPDNPYSASPIPNFYIAAPIDTGDNFFWAGIGVSAPFGLGSEYEDDDFVSFDSTKTELKTINIAPSIAFNATDWLAVGGGIDIQYADAILENFVNLGPGGTGTSRLEGDDLSFGYNVGVLASVTDRTDIGLHYRSSVKHDLDGNVSLSGTLADFDIGGQAKLNLPDIATMGIGHDVTDQLRVMGQATWFKWSNFDEIRTKNLAGGTLGNVEQNYNNTWAFSVGAEYDVNEKFTVRGGYQFDETPTVDAYRTSRTPDGDRNWFSAGATYKLNDHMEFDFAATYIDVDDGTIDVSRNGGTAQVTGTTGGDVKIFAAGLNYKF